MWFDHMCLWIDETYVAFGRVMPLTAANASFQSTTHTRCTNNPYNYRDTMLLTFHIFKTHIWRIFSIYNMCSRALSG